MNEPACIRSLIAQIDSIERPEESIVNAVVRLNREVNELTWAVSTKDAVIAGLTGRLKDSERRKSRLTTWLVVVGCIAAAGWTLVVIRWMGR